MNVKMYLPDTEKPRKELSREVQEHAFKLGYSWRSGKDIRHLEKPLLFMDGDKKINFADRLSMFDYKENIEITPQEFLALPIPEPEFDESKVLTWYNRHEAVVGREYRCGGNMDHLKKGIHVHRLTDIDKNNFSPFHTGKYLWAALYPVED